MYVMKHYGCACNVPLFPLQSLEMKQLYVTLIILAVIAFVIWFDAVVVFLLSGFIPGINITLSPSTMLAVMIASAVMVAVVRHRFAVYRRCLSFYDEFFGISKKDTPPSGKTTGRPRRRYQEL